MAVLDDLEQFVKDNTLDGSWHKPQLRKRCEEFLENADISGGGGMSDRITPATLEAYDWPVLDVAEDESGSYIAAEVVDNIVGNGDTDMSYMINCIGNLFVVYEFNESHGTYRVLGRPREFATIEISKDTYVRLLDTDGQQVYGFTYMLESGRYELDGSQPT